MANSLREVSEKETIKITEFRIVLNHIKKDNSKVLILVEGNTDIKFFRKIFNTDHSIVKELNGKDKIKNILNTLLSDFNNVFGINLTQNTPQNEIPQVNNTTSINNIN